MNTKIILGLGTSVLLASSLFASPNQSNMKQGDGPSCGHHKMMKHQKHGRGHSLVKMFKKLDLSDKQRTEIRAMIKESMKSRVNPHVAFTDSSFNKEQFVKLAKQKRDNRIERKAELIEKIYKVLNSSQKKDLKTMLDMRDIMKKNHKMQKSCNKAR